MSQTAAVPWRPTGAEGGGGSIVGSRAAAASELLQIEAAGAKSAPDSAGAWVPGRHLGSLGGAPIWSRLPPMASPTNHPRPQSRTTPPKNVIEESSLLILFEIQKSTLNVTKRWSHTTSPECGTQIYLVIQIKSEVHQFAQGEVGLMHTEANSLSFPWRRSVITPHPVITIINSVHPQTDALEILPC